eukprot:TRINITY_DN4840_c0_g1_i3.p2 TRINITY_DN4840_c0_g1~~TRINITY_DN4840_c0_g1_i3.p2  ORF type:complete len:105 (+),score=7.05 TRINITY_DN4840_c0_g1_i3:118-432(+)
METDIQIKVLILGEPSGKSSILNRYVNDTFNEAYNATFGCEIATKNITVKDKNVKVQICDIAGQEGFRGLTTAFYRNYGAAIIVYDITNRSTFESVQKLSLIHI